MTVKSKKSAGFTIQNVIRDLNGDYIIAETGQPLPDSICQTFAFLFPQSSDRKPKKRKV
jgi:hypothetical protein